jgi:NADH:ubiquinone reductase (H+-translocating)
MPRTMGSSRIGRRVCIAGAGYGGVSSALRLARRLQRRDVITLISPAARFVERIRLHQRMAGQDVGEWDLRELLRGSGVQLLLGRLQRIDCEQRSLALEDAALEFDDLVLALGSRIDMDSVPGVRQHALALELDSVAAAHRAVTHAAAHGGTVVIVGGGLTGIELAAELAESLPRVEVVLVAQDSLAETWSDAARRHALSSLQRLGVTVQEQLHVRAVHVRRLETDRGDIPFDACLWCGGFVAHPLAVRSGLAVNERGQALVDAQLQSVSHPHVHVAGDLAAFSVQSGLAMPMGCKSAMPAGAWVAENVARRSDAVPERPFSYRTPFFCVSLGRRDGLIQMAARDGTMRGRVLTGRGGAWFKELICRSTMWALQLERAGISGIQWARRAEHARLDSGEAVSDER